MKASRTLLVEGWRFIPHSFAIVNQFQCLELLKQENLILRHHDVPYFGGSWQATAGLFEKSAEDAIRDLRDLAPGEIPDAVLRISYPFNISASNGRRTFVFGTAEHQCVPACDIMGNRPLAEACASCDATIIAPSKWSRDGFIHSGASPDRVAVVPHGTDPGIFHPVNPSEQAGSRGKMGWSGFIFLTIGAMSANKGVTPLLKAFAAVAQKYPHVRLAMKGMAALYDSKKFIESQIQSLTQAQISLVHPRIMFLQQTFSFADIAKLYQMADAYVSPYLAEGFNMPVLEAVASGLPVICTRGGPTDDFTSGDFVLYVNAARIGVREHEQLGFELQVDLDHLVHQMMQAVESRELAAKARTEGPAFVAAGHTWGHVVQSLLKVLFAN